MQPQSDRPDPSYSGWKAWLLVILVFGALFLLIGANVTNTILHPLFTAQIIPVKNATYHDIRITDYRNASDVSYADLLRFLNNDTTETHDYVYPNYTCGDFAVRLHDNAEANGIRCGFVAVNINTSGYSGLISGDANESDKGHAFDVFNTTDRGLVFIDATGVKKSEKKQGREPLKMVVYFEEGKPLGEIALNQSEEFDYAYYQQREKTYSPFANNVSLLLDDIDAYTVEANASNVTKNAYNKDVDRFNDEYERFCAALNSSQTSIISKPGEASRLEQWREDLAGRLSELDTRLYAIQMEDQALSAEKRSIKDRRAMLEQYDESQWLMTEPMGVVDNVAIYW